MAEILNLPTPDALEIAELTPRKTYYAVYDSCVSNNIASWDLAFIEERLSVSGIVEPTEADELFFDSLRDAKAYVKGHFRSGAEYFSLAQLSNPDAILHIIADKVTYMIA